MWWVHALQSWDYFSTKSPVSTHFSTGAWDFVCRSFTTLRWSVAALHVRCGGAPVVVNFVISIVSDIADYEIYHSINTCCGYKRIDLSIQVEWTKCLSRSVEHCILHCDAYVFGFQQNLAWILSLGVTSSPARCSYVGRRKFVMCS